MLTEVILYASIGMLVFGFHNAILKGLVDVYGPIRSIVLRNIVAVCALSVGFFVFQPALSFTAESFIMGVIISALGYFPFMFYMSSLEFGKVSVMTTVAKSRVVVASIFGFSVLGDVFSLEKVCAVSVIVAGIFLTTIDFRDLKNSAHWSWKSGVPLALLAGLGWGIILPLFKFPSAALGALFFALMVEVAVLLGACAHLILQKQSLFPNSFFSQMTARNAFFILLAGLATAVGTTFQNMSYETGEIALASAIGGSAVVITVITARFLFKEHLYFRQYVGIGVALLGIVLAAGI